VDLGLQHGGGAVQLLAFSLTRHPFGVNDDVVHGESGRVLGQNMQVTLHRENRPSPPVPPPS